MKLKLSQPGEPIIPGREDQLAPGLRGCAMEHHGAIYLPLLFADKPGNGALTRFLDELEAEYTVKVPTVLNDDLAAYLVRRGYRFSIENDEDWGAVEVFVKEAAQVEGEVDSGPLARPRRGSK